MPLGLAFWILMFLWLCFGIWDWRQGWANWYYNGVFFFVLFLLLGWHSFGSPIR